MGHSKEKTLKEALLRQQWASVPPVACGIIDQAEVQKDNVLFYAKYV